jgi:hypothetical protein
MGEQASLCQTHHYSDTLVIYIAGKWVNSAPSPEQSARSRGGVAPVRWDYEEEVREGQEIPEGRLSQPSTLIYSSDRG